MMSSTEQARPPRRKRPHPARRARKDDETLLLADRIPVAGSRGHGLRSAGADVVSIEAFPDVTLRVSDFLPAV